MKKFLPNLFFLFVFISITAQTEESFSRSNHFYIQGNSVLIGNNILGHHPTKALMDNSIANDAVKMKYINVDRDKRIFSSSQASITDIPKNSKIVYAGLYWTALYPHKKGKMSKAGGRISYKGKGKRDPKVNQILFKIPTSRDYVPILGEVIVNGFETEEFLETAPYVSKADVTEMLQDLSDVNGTYTLANIRATEGSIPGGGSAGWMLYIIYENENESLKYFTTYDGLIDVDKNVIDINFSDFKSAEDGKVRPVFGVGALEGDRKIHSDQLLLWSEKEKDFIALSNGVRAETNFFNSSITLDENLFVDRNPNSSNTLGFDLLKMNVENPQNIFFDEKSTSTTLRFQTRADRYYVFFVSFEIEIDKSFLNKTDGIILNEDGLAEHEKTTGKEKVVSEIYRSKEFVDMENIEVPNLPSGYYLISNVFSIPENAEEWKKFLISKNFKPDSFINPENGWKYIYFDFFADPVEAILEVRDKRNISFFEEIWVLKVN